MLGLRRIDKKMVIWRAKTNVKISKFIKIKLFYSSLDLLSVYDNTIFYQKPYICSKGIKQNTILNINQGS